MHCLVISIMQGTSSQDQISGKLNQLPPCKLVSRLGYFVGPFSSAKASPAQQVVRQTYLLCFQQPAHAVTSSSVCTGLGVLPCKVRSQTCLRSAPFLTNTNAAYQLNSLLYAHFVPDLMSHVTQAVPLPAPLHVTAICLVTPCVSNQKIASGS